MTPEPLDALLARIDAAVRARERLRARPLGMTIAALVAAAARWRADETLIWALPGAARLSPPMVAAYVPVAAGALEAGAMTELVERAWGVDAATRPAGPGPTVVAHVLASNVPALALPAIALSCLAGAVVVVKSGRHDSVSAPALHRALAQVDPDLAATIVTTYWSGGDRAREDAVLRRADVVVATGGNPALGAIEARTRGRLIAHGPRWSIALVGCNASRDLQAVATAAARDVAAYDQRGCLSAHALYVEGDASTARALAERLAAALEEQGQRLPPGPATVPERAAARVARAETEWAPGGMAFGGPLGTVLHHAAPAIFAPTCGQRTVRVYPLPALAALPELLPPGMIECVGVAALDPTRLVAALRARGVARLCPLGRMQSPALTWPRGQQPPLGALLRDGSPPEIAVDA